MKLAFFAVLFINTRLMEKSERSGKWNASWGIVTFNFDKRERVEKFTVVKEGVDGRIKFVPGRTYSCLSSSLVLIQVNGSVESNQHGNWSTTKNWPESRAPREFVSKCSEFVSGRIYSFLVETNASLINEFKFFKEKFGSNRRKFVVFRNEFGSGRM